MRREIIGLSLVEEEIAVIPTKDERGLAMAGRALYGNRWQTNLAMDLGVHPRTVRGWAAGDRPIPPGQWRYITALLQQRARDCREIAWMISLQSQANSKQKTRSAN